MASCHTHATLLGGAAVSAAPTKQTLRQHYNPPTEFTEFTESSGGEEPPTDFADAHRFFFSANNFFVLCEDSLVAAWVWQGCHTLLWLALFCDEVEFMSCQYSIFFFVTNSV